MKDVITINPATNEIKILGNALKTRNEFLALGFSSRGAFIEIVQEKLPKYKDYKNVRTLENWWLLRLKNEELNNELDRVLETLRYE